MSIGSFQTEFKITYSKSLLRLNPPDSDLSKVLHPIRTYELCLSFAFAVVNVMLLLVLCHSLCECFLPSQGIALREKGPYCLFSVYTTPCHRLPLYYPEVGIQDIPPEERDILQVKAEIAKRNPFS